MERMIIPICEHVGYPIVLHMPEGVFEATVEETQVTSASLSDLRGRLTAMQTKAQQKSRRAMAPVPIWMVCVDKHSITFELREVLGVVAGRSYTQTVRTAQGQVVTHHIVGLRPSDARIAWVQEVLGARNKAEAVFVQARSAWDACVKALPFVEVPNVLSREDALDKEPAFLEALRNIPIERDRADCENSQVPA